MAYMKDVWVRGRVLGPPTCMGRSLFIGVHFLGGPGQSTSPASQVGASGVLTSFMKDEAMH